MTDLRLGAVAYDPKVVTIWSGFRAWLRDRNLDLDYVLYSNYEGQVEALVDGQIDLAWNSPLAWVRSRRLAEARGLAVSASLMRDTDRDLTSVVVVRADSEIADLADLAGRTVGVGAVDSPQATLLPLAFLRGAGLTPGTEVKVRRFDVGVGLHGDHVGGERDAVVALRDGTVDAACILDSNVVLFGTEGTVAPGSLRVLAETAPYDHCNLTVGPSADPRAVARLDELFLAMSYADPEARVLLDLEGLRQWVTGRTSGYDALEASVDAFSFYDVRGEVTAVDYRP